MDNNTNWTNVSIQDLEKAIKDYPMLESMLRPILDGKQAEEAKRKAQEAFTKGIEKALKAIAFPEDIRNVIIVKHVSEQAVTIKDDDGNEQTTPAGTITYEYMPNVYWTKDKPTSGNSKGSSGISKRAITVKKVVANEDGSEGLRPIGNFKTGHEACVYLDLDDTGNSAIRVLQANGYITSGYIGTNFTINS